MRVVVTRPQPQADATAAKLLERGHHPIVLPLTEIVALQAPHVDSDKARAIAVTSANALRNADAKLLEKLIALPLFAVGDRTAAIARDAGFADIQSASGDVEALTSLMLRNTVSGDSILYLCGRPRRPEFESALHQAGRAVSTIETYETRLLAIRNHPDVLQEADAVLVYAQSAAQALNALDWRQSRAVFICMSERVAEAIDLPRERIRVASRPDGEAMFAEIDGVG